MTFLTNLIQPLSHCEDSVMFLLKRLRVKITRSTLQQDLTEHPDYPSLLAIMDVLRNYGVENVAIRIAREDWSNDISCPFLVHAKGRVVNHDIFAVITALSENNVEIYNPETKRIELLSDEDFDKIYKGVVLAVESNENAGEKNYKKALIKEKRNKGMQMIAFLALPICTILSCLMLLGNESVSNRISVIIFTLLALSGSVVSMLLLWNEIDEYNPVLKQICQAGKKVNCSAILNSSAARIFGISWSSIGFTYFTGMLLLLLSGGSNSATITTLLSWINILAIPYVFFSIYYQWKVARQWCLLCLMVQSLLVLQFATSMGGHFYSLAKPSDILFKDYLAVFVVFIFILTVIIISIPALEKAKSNRLKTLELQRLKHNPQIFDALLTRQKSIESPMEGLTIKKGNSNGKYKLLKVCNPYCPPCAEAHPILEDLLDNNDEIGLEIIFTATIYEKDRKREPVLHLMAIANENNSELTKQALNDWYNAPEKNYVFFAEKYPIQKEVLDSQSEKIKGMHDWCDAMDVTSTPTFFLNGYKLPEMYSVADLKYFLTV
jgi:uncharacterized membrane protein